MIIPCSICNGEIGLMVGKPFIVFTTCSSFIGPMKCFCGCKCHSHIGPTSLGLYYGNHGLKGKLNHNNFNTFLVKCNLLQVQQTLVTYKGFGWDTQVKVHHGRGM
jgi:hypothetical protein